MQNLITKLLKSLNENHAIAIGSVIVIVICLYGYGCQSKVPSMLEPELKVNRAELETEVEFLLSRARNRLEELDRQDQIKLLIFEQAALFAQSGVINPMGILTTAVSVVAVGSALDQRRKKKVLEEKLS